jgi:Fe-Mn family superoxide dismutase
MSFTTEDLPYPKNALEPNISARTVEFHYEKHHKGYVAKLNEIAKNNQSVASRSIEQLIKEEKSGKVFNLAGQIWNHTFYWKSMSPNGGGEPTGKIAECINKSFGSFEKLKQEFNDAAVNHFGSGWAWLVRDENSNNLSVVTTHDAGCPITENKVPLLSCDVWEHSYYLDYQNRRQEYCEKWWNVVNWKFAEQNLKH